MESATADLAGKGTVLPNGLIVLDLGNILGNGVCSCGLPKLFSFTYSITFL